MANAESSERLSAIKFIVDVYPDLSSKLQQNSIGMFSGFLTLEPTIQNCPPEICDPETKIVEDSEGKGMPRIQDWNKALEQLKLDLWVSLQSLMDGSQFSGQSRDSVLALNEEVIGLPLSSELRNKLLNQPLE